MSTTLDIIHEAEQLPVEQRTMVVDSILRTLNRPDPDVDKKWGAVAKRRLDEMRSGKVTPVPGDEVFARIRQRFSS
jgi:putative addiction module component (TIGR02574 family)